MPADPCMPDGEALPPLGLGTWRLGEDAAAHGREVAALRLALQMGYRLFDTAEMYGAGGAEDVLGEALAQALAAGEVARESVFVVTKVLPQHATPQAMADACERSLRRLRLDHIDLYLLHWRGGAPLALAVRGFEALQRRGWIRHWGVSNFDLADLTALISVPGGSACAANQLYYSLSERGIELELLPWQQRHGIPTLAYCPLDQGVLARHPSLQAIARRHGATPAQVALAWLMGRGVVAIPKAVHACHLLDDIEARQLVLDGVDRRALDHLFPLPRHARTMAIA